MGFGWIGSLITPGFFLIEIFEGLKNSKAIKNRKDQFGTRYTVNIKIRIFGEEVIYYFYIIPWYLPLNRSI